MSEPSGEKIESLNPKCSHNEQIAAAVSCGLDSCVGGRLTAGCVVPAAGECDGGVR